MNTSKKAEKVGPHLRQDWDGNCPADVVVHAPSKHLYGLYDDELSGKSLDEFVAAVSFGHFQHAFDIVDRCYNIDAVDFLDAIILRHMSNRAKNAERPRIVVPSPEWDPGSTRIEPGLGVRNVLAFAYAKRLSKELGCEIETGIRQIARPGPEKLTGLERFLWQPKFSGEIRPNRAYIMVDDKCKFGGTFAVLRSYIVENGGIALAATTLGHSTGQTHPFCIQEQTRASILGRFTEDVDALLRQEIGHDSSQFTDQEGQGLLRWADRQQDHENEPWGKPLLEQLRDEIAGTRSRGGMG